MIHPAYFLLLRETKWTTKITTIVVHHTWKTDEAINRSPCGNLSRTRHSSNFFLCCRHVRSSYFRRTPAPFLKRTEQGSSFTKILSLFLRTLSIRNVCRRIPWATPYTQRTERGAQRKKMPSKGRRLWSLLIPMTWRWKIKEDNGRRQWQNEKGCRRMYQL